MLHDIKNRFSQYRHQIVLDWDGVYSRLHEFRPGLLNIILYDEKGEILTNNVNEIVDHFYVCPI